jgi:hypothetical protein
MTVHKELPDGQRFVTNLYSKVPMRLSLSSQTEVSFEHDLAESFRQLRSALSAVLTAMNANIDVPNAMTRQFRIDKSLAWKLSRVVKTSDPFDASLDVPGAEAMRGFIDQMAKIGTPRKVLEPLEAAMNQFLAMLEKHCGDRATLEMMAASAAGPSQRKQQQLENFRRMLFRSGGATFGVQASLHIAQHFLLPSGSGVDVARVVGLNQFRRIRAGTPWPLACAAPRSGGQTRYEPLDEKSVDHVPLLTRYTQPPITLITEEAIDGYTRFVIPDGPVGLSAARDVYAGWIERGVGVSGAIPELRMTLGTPVELAVHELFIHRDLASTHEFKAQLQQQLPGSTGGSPLHESQRGLMPMLEMPEQMPADESKTIDGFARYPEMMADLFTRLKSSPRDFKRLRVSLPFPPIATMLVFRGVRK